MHPFFLPNNFSLPPSGLSLAMSETMSSPANWAQFYHHDHSAQTPPLGDQVSDATVITTTVTSSPHASATTGSTTAPHLNPDGRVSKPIRRRSRASRRTPTTLLNTDTSNFRAMVQQFTGGPSAPFASHPAAAAAPNFGFGLGSRPHHPTALMVPPGFHLQQQYHQQQQQQQQYMHMFPLSNNNNNNNTTPHSDGFLQRLTATRPNMGVSNELGLEGGFPSSRPASSNENRGSNYIF